MTITYLKYQAPSRGSLERSPDGECPEELRFGECGDGCQVSEPQLSDTVSNPDLHNEDRQTEVTSNPITTSNGDSGLKYRSEGENKIDRQTNIIESQTGESSSNAQRPIEPSELLCTSAASKDELQAWASGQVQKLQAEIQTLKGDVAGRTNTVASIDQDIRNLKEEYDKYKQTAGQDIVRGLMEIKEDYNMKLDILKAKLMQLAESRIKELDEEYNRKLDYDNQLQEGDDRKFDALSSKLRALGESRRNEVKKLNGNTLEISWKMKGLLCYQDIIKYLESETTRKM